MSLGHVLSKMRMESFSLNRHQLQRREENTREEFKVAIRKMRDKRSIGSTCVTAEMFKGMKSLSVDGKTIAFRKIANEEEYQKVGEIVQLLHYTNVKGMLQTTQSIED